MLLAGPNKSSPAGRHPGVFPSAGKVDRLEMCTSAPKSYRLEGGSWGPPILGSQVWRVSIGKAAVLGPVTGDVTHPGFSLGWELSRANSWGS